MSAWCHCCVPLKAEKEWLVSEATFLWPGSVMPKMSDLAFLTHVEDGGAWREVSGSLADETSNKA